MLKYCLLVALLLAPHGSAFDSWLDRRDADLVRQQRDFSCGLAALATVLSFAFNDPVSEEELLRELLRQRGVVGSVSEDPGISFADLAALAMRRGYSAWGYELQVEDLPVFRVPVIVSLQVAGREHFSVLRSIDGNGSALLADPSWGNRRIAPWRFRSLFQHPGAVGPDHRESRGRVLLITPMIDGPLVEASVVEAPVKKAPRKKAPGKKAPQQRDKTPPMRIQIAPRLL